MWKIQHVLDSDLDHNSYITLLPTPPVGCLAQAQPTKPVSPYGGYNGQLRSGVYQPTEIALIAKSLTMVSVFRVITQTFFIFSFIASTAVVSMRLSTDGPELGDTSSHRPVSESRKWQELTVSLSGVVNIAGAFLGWLTLT